MASSPASVRRPFGYARVAIGAAMAVAPGLVGKLWWDREIGPAASAILRGMGARDAVIGAGTALVGDEASVAWLRAGVVADLADATAAALAGSSLPTSKRAVTVAFGAAGALAGVLIARAAR
ncbi:MAG TPA: hypothetical protein VFP61_11855 [Acidimicrobiales bacterium]|nr:hypothetical protein [Acidimicrobiales bacterium]